MTTPTTSRRTSPIPEDVLVVGAGLAGAQTVAALRTHGYAGAIRVLGAEDVPPYDRPPLSKHLLDRPEPAWLTDELGLDLHGLADDVRLGVTARALRLDGDRPGATVVTDDGAHRASCVVLATGSHAVRVPAWPSALTLHSAADADRLRAALDGAPRRLVVVGAGWVGAEVAGVAAAAGHHVTVVEARDAPLVTGLGSRVGALTAPWYAAAGVDLRTRATVAAVEDGAVRLADGAVLPADVVLVAVGARPAAGWLADALPLDGGAVPVDEAYRVLGPDGPLDGVLAVGDVARRRSARHGWVPGGHWDEALRGPDVLVRRLLGVDDGDAELTPYVFSTQLGHDLTMFGLRGDDDAPTVLGDPADGGWSVLWTRAADGAVTAALTVDRPRDVGAARRLLGGPELPVVPLDGASTLAELVRRR
ncbi:NAD(P)/FAD-dependent oxidoreductase [Cellulomonas sp. 179-A 9B4 NHS]|uniref:NAD(P)/FAD-dependent oxidoreductase n=1 Tax=Cellulomonas sp. 179-A 9B4 NHS TaxID=3142379 RepID=UPI0039A24FFF